MDNSYDHSASEEEYEESGSEKEENNDSCSLYETVEEKTEDSKHESERSEEPYQPNKNILDKISNFRKRSPSSMHTMSSILQREDKNVIQENIKSNDIFEYQANYKLTQSFIPNTFNGSVDCCESAVYGGRFSANGDIYCCTTQRRILIFNTEDVYKWKVFKMFDGRYIQWTITDTDLDQQQRFLAYSSITTRVNVIDITHPGFVQETLNFGGDEADSWENSFRGIYSVKFSGIGTELVAGASGGIVLIYDMASERVELKLRGHMDDINSVCFADRDHSNIFYTGSDDCFIKVWDRRIIGTHHNEPVGVFIGHQEGITNIASKGDGVYLASNGKDQLLKLWDMRKLSPDSIRKTMPPLKKCGRFDYRWTPYPFRGNVEKHSRDTSVQTFSGHHVLQTLIRCSFSPARSTNQRYLYTGSADGGIYIFDTVTGEKVSNLQKNPYYSAARDVSWHPTQPFLTSTSFKGKIVTWKYKC